MWRATCALLLLGLAACTRTPPPLANTFDSSGALATAVLAAVVAGDQARLASLALSEREFRDHIWPDLPAARPERNLPFSYVWGDLQQKSDAGRRAVVAQYRGRAMALVDVRFGEVATYGRYGVHRDAVFAVRNGEGTTEEVRVCGSMVQLDGRWKVFSYIAGD